jgi:hypothetical protein
MWFSELSVIFHNDDIECLIRHDGNNHFFHRIIDISRDQKHWPTYRSFAGVVTKQGITCNPHPYLQATLGSALKLKDDILILRKIMRS